MQAVTPVLFIVVLLSCVALGAPTIAPLLAGLALFCGYALLRGSSLSRVARMCWNGVRPIAGILGMLLLVGALTGMWRAAGVIPAIVCYAAPLITPGVFLVMVFLLNCLVSVLTGTSFGTAATMGAISISLASAMGVPLAVAGGAALSGAFFGDRWSPLSTSALLVANVTGTDFYGNLRRMLGTTVVPFVATCAVYLALGALLPAGQATSATVDALRASFDLAPLVLAPPALVLLLALLRVRILIVLVAGVCSAVPLGMALQGMGAAEVVRTVLVGYVAPSPEVAALAGGGVASMISSVGIVVVTSAYAGIFAETDLLAGVDRAVSALSERLSAFATALAVSVFTSMISCNQTLAIMLSRQLCQGLPGTPEEQALDLEDTVVVVAGLVPWSIAGGVPLASMGAPVSGMAFAVFLYLVPVARLLRQRLVRRDGRGRAVSPGGREPAA